MNSCLGCWEGELAWTAEELARGPPGPLPGPPPEPLPTELKDRLTETDDGLNGVEMELGWMELPEETEPGADEE